MIINLEPNTVYTDRLIIERHQHDPQVVSPLLAMIIRSPSPSSPATIHHVTSNPYESTVLINSPAATITLENVNIRHTSPSIANNFAVQLINADNVVLSSCDISSTTGSGVGIEGGSPRLENCRIHDCARSGVMIFSSLYFDDDDDNGGGGTVVVRDCVIAGNAQHGILVRDGARPFVLHNRIECSSSNKNSYYAIAIQNAGGRYRENSIVSGSVAVHLLLGEDGEDDARDIGSANLFVGPREGGGGGGEGGHVVAAMVGGR